MLITGYDFVGSISQTLTYPFDVLRRKMQVRGMGALGIQYNGALDALRVIVRTEGFKGLYRGLWPNLRECSSFSVPFFSILLCVPSFLPCGVP